MSPVSNTPQKKTRGPRCYPEHPQPSSFGFCHLAWSTSRPSGTSFKQGVPVGCHCTGSYRCYSWCPTHVGNALLESRSWSATSGCSYLVKVLLRFVVNDGWWDSKLRFPSSTLDLLFLWKHLQHQVRQWKSKGSSLYGLSRGNYTKIHHENHRTKKIQPGTIRDLFQKKSIPKTATRWSNSWWTTRWMTLLLPVCVLQRLKFRSQYYDVAISVSWIPKRWLFETFLGGHWWRYTLLPCEYPPEN